MKENEIFYAFSTISQTLGGVVTIIAAFVLYRFQLINEKIKEECLDFIQKIDHEALFGRAVKTSSVSKNINIKKLILTKRFIEFCDYLAELILYFDKLAQNESNIEMKKIPVKHSEDVSIYYISLKYLVKGKLTIRRWAIFSFIVTFATIIFSIFILMNTIEFAQCYSSHISYLGFFAVLICLITYFRLMITIFNEQ